jgi:exonuclease 3'-5' domain-containing protein 1
LALVDNVHELQTNSPSINIDLEGINLSRDGTISLITILAQPSLPQRWVYLLDVHTLGDLAFTTARVKSTTLNAILEPSAIPKVFFDVRNDLDALYAQFNISL